MAEFIEFCVNGRTSKSGKWDTVGTGKYLEGAVSGGRSKRCVEEMLLFQHFGGGKNGKHKFAAYCLVTDSVFFPHPL